MNNMDCLAHIPPYSHDSWSKSQEFISTPVMTAAVAVTFAFFCPSCWGARWDPTDGSGIQKREIY